MIRVGFVIAATDGGWIGGLNYLSNLIQAVNQIPDRDIEPVLLVSDRTPDQLLAGFPDIERVRTPLVTEGTLARKARKALERGLGRDVLFEAFLNQHRIDVLSHSDQLGRFASIPTIGWIADFQHVRMPEFFEPRELDLRDRGFRRLVDHCSIVLLSSHDARNDFSSFAPAQVGKSRVLKFVSGLNDTVRSAPIEELSRKYNFSGPFFHLPNQFWAHKNHCVVIEALGILKSRGVDVTVVSTGNTKDRRRPDYFPRLKDKLAELGLETNLRILGLVPYEDVKGLLKHSMAVINPSFFEGWSTTVEESKSLGKRILLSDIAVHREQAPERGRYFTVDDAAGLADLMLDVQVSFNPEEEREAEQAALERRTAAFAAFGRNYQLIVVDAIAARDRRRKGR